MPTTDTDTAEVHLGRGYRVEYAPTRRTGIYNATLRLGTGYHGHHQGDAGDDPQAWATAWATNRIQALEKKAAILEALGARAKAVAATVHDPDKTLVADRFGLFGGAAVTIHAAGHWRRAVVNRVTAKRVEVVWAAPSTGTLHVKSVPKGEVLR